MENSTENDGVHLHKKVWLRFIFPFVRAESCCLIRERGRHKEFQDFHTLANTHASAHTNSHIQIKVGFSEQHSILDLILEKRYCCVFVLLKMPWSELSYNSVDSADQSTFTLVRSTLFSYLESCLK